MMKKCLICEEKIGENPLWSVCSNICFLILTQAINHKETACWISCEVYCKNGYCASFDEKGIKEECEIFRIERVIKERGLDKEELIGSY